MTNKFKWYHVKIIGEDRKEVYNTKIHKVTIMDIKFTLVFLRMYKYWSSLNLVG